MPIYHSTKHEKTKTNDQHVMSIRSSLTTPFHIDFGYAKTIWTGSVSKRAPMEQKIRKATKNENTNALAKFKCNRGDPNKWRAKNAD